MLRAIGRVQLDLFLTIGTSSCLDGIAGLEVFGLLDFGFERGKMGLSIAWILFIQSSGFL